MKYLGILLVALPVGCSSSNPGAQSSHISALMKELDGELHKQAGKLVKSQPVNWSEVEPLAQRYSQLAVKVSRLLPERGSSESWKRQTAVMVSEANRLEVSAAKKNQHEAWEAWNNLNKSCGNCHEYHR